MSTINEIQRAILALPEADYVQLRRWFSELDWKKWDEQIEADSQAGKLDSLGRPGPRSQIRRDSPLT